MNNNAFQKKTADSVNVIDVLYSIILNAYILHCTYVNIYIWTLNRKLKNTLWKINMKSWEKFQNGMELNYLRTKQSMLRAEYTKWTANTMNVTAIMRFINFEW